MTVPMPQPLASPATLIFDFGGVVFRWNPAQLLARVLPERIRSAAEAEHWKGLFFQSYTGDWGAFDQGLIDVPELCQRIAQRTGISEAEVQAVVDAVADELAPLPGTVALIHQLKARGHRLLYLSNMPAPYARHLLAHQPVLAAFEQGVFSSAVRLCKPDPAIYRHALAQFGLMPSQALFIDDHPENISAAQQLGLPAWLFTGAPALAEELNRRGLLPPPG